jgi:hypothetical protein
MCNQIREPDRYYYIDGPEEVINMVLREETRKKNYSYLHHKQGWVWTGPRRYDLILSPFFIYGWDLV